MRCSPMFRDTLKGLASALKASAPAVVAIAWIAAVSLLGIYGESKMASSALGVLAMAGGMGLYYVLRRI